MPCIRFITSIVLILFYEVGFAQPSTSLDSLRSLVESSNTDSLTRDNRMQDLYKAYLEQAKRNRSKEDIIFAYQQLATMAYKVGDIHQALHYYKLFALELEQFNDYHTAKQEQFDINLYKNEIKALHNKIKLLEQENARLAATRNDYYEKNYWIYLGLRLILIIGIVLLAGWAYLKFKKADKTGLEKLTDDADIQPLAEVLSSTKMQLAHAETELALADILAQHVMHNSDVPFDNNKVLPNKFLIQQSKNLSSGDGVYLETLNKKTIIIVYDTPGDGASGGLLNHQVFSFIDNLVKKQEILSPNLLLHQIEDKITKLFPAGVPFAGGINMAICLYDNSTNKMLYAGANMDLYMVYKASLTTYSGAETGILQEGNNTNFQITEIRITAGMNFYLCTKGFWQQIGGHENKPLGKEAFEKTLTSCSSQTLAEQEQILLKIFSDWQGRNEQTDDMLVLGFAF